MIDRRSYKTIAFDSADARDAYLEREHPDRKALEQPGTYSLPNGDELGVFLNSVTIYAARFVQGAELAQAARESTAIEVEAGSALTPEREADLWQRGEVRQAATRVRDVSQRAQEYIAQHDPSIIEGPDRALELLDELADAAGALVEAQAAGERAPRPPMDPPPGAIAYKYADPTEGARWLYDETEPRRIRSEDPNLIVAVEPHGTSRRDFEAELAMALLEAVDELETAHGILERLEPDAIKPDAERAAVERVLNAESESTAQADRRRLLQERLNDPRRGLEFHVEGSGHPGRWRVGIWEPAIEAYADTLRYLGAINVGRDKARGEALAERLRGGESDAS